VDSRSGCYCGIEIDGMNYIQCQPYSIDKIPEFTRSYVHDKLNLSYNFIRNITNRSFHQLKVRKIYLQQNLIESIDKESFHSNILNYLEELHLDMLTNGSLEFLCFGTWNKLRVLGLSGFNFNQYGDCLEKFHRLEKLIIKNTQINLLTHHLYKLPNLHELSLISNQIESLNFDNNIFPSSSSIKILNLTSNQLRTIPNDLVHRMPQLQTLDLSHNLIENIPIIQFNHLININLSYNLINYIQLNDNENNYDLSFNPICTLEKTRLNENFVFKYITQLHCDCRLAFFLEDNLLNKSELIGIHQPFDNETKCSTPLTVHGLFLKDLTYEQLLTTCTDDLPMNCREVNHFKTIQKYTKDIIGIPTTSNAQSK
jgi:Leucine-rich repeat (LRR) protein